MTQDEPKFDPSPTEELLPAERYEPDLLTDIVKAIPPMPPEHGTKVIKHIDWLINQARALDKRKIEQLAPLSNKWLEICKLMNFYPENSPEHMKIDITGNENILKVFNEKAEAKIQELEAKVQLLKTALKPAAEKWRYSGFTKAGVNPTTEYFDIRVTREELAAMHTAYHDT